MARPALSARDLFVLPPGSEKTFSHDSKLPSLPVPPLRHTLERYLESLVPFVSAAEHKHSKRLVNEFETGVGKDLHQKLVQRASVSKNWVHTKIGYKFFDNQQCNSLETWWEDLAYLSVRLPLVPHCSMMGIGLHGVLEKLPFPNDQLKVTAIYMYHVTSTWVFLRQETMRPTRGGDNALFSMSQFRHLYNTVRVPGEQIDSLKCYFKTESEGPCPDHVIVLCNGHIFSMSALNETGSPLSPDDWETQLRKISVSSKEEGPGVGVLTCDDRTTWAKNRNHLERISLENRTALHIIDTAMCIVVLDQEVALTQGDVALKSWAGDGSNRWADKCIAVHCFKNGTVGGLCDHAAFDGMISMTAMYYNYLAMQEPLPPQHSAKVLPPPTEICFHLDQSMRGEIQLAKARSISSRSLVLVVYEKFTGYGKQMIQAHRLHPDSFVQLALQLAYYKLHHKPAPAYETATTRAYYNGRTETVRSCTEEVVRWVKAMQNTRSSVAEKRGLLRSAIQKHDVLMKEAKNNAGCDRHLFGLYCVALEEGIPIPALYSDPAYSKSGGSGNFALSTSLVGYTPILGGVAPMCQDGYGCFYNICPENLGFTVSVWRSSSESSATKFYRCLEQSLVEMMDVLGPILGKL